MGHTFVTQEPSFIKKKPSWACEVCNGQHGVWASESFKKMTVPKRWEVATEHKLCFRCLADGHRGEACFRSRVFGLSGCRSAHHRMLHEDEVDNKTAHSDSIIRSDLTKWICGWNR